MTKKASTPNSLTKPRCLTGISLKY